MGSRGIGPFVAFALCASCGSGNTAQEQDNRSLPLVTVDALGDHWVESSVRDDLGSAAVDPPCGTPPFSDADVRESSVTEYENDADSLGLTEAVVRFEDNSSVVEAARVWRSLDCEAEQFSLATLELDSESSFGYELRFEGDSGFAQTIIVTSLNKSLSIIVSTGPTDQVTDVAQRAAGL